MKRKIIWTAAFLLVVVMLLGGGAALVPPIERALQHRRVEAAISRFQASPSEQRAQELIGLLDRQIATPEQGQRILEMVLYPEVRTRPSYALGPAPTFSIARRFHVRFPKSVLSVGASLWSQGERQHGYSSSGGNTLATDPYIYALHPNPDETGVYEAEIRCEYGVTPLVGRTTWSWKPWRGPFPRGLFPRGTTAWSTIPGSGPLYACQFAVPVELKVVEPGQAEEIELLSDPNLDARMRMAFTASPAARQGGYSTPKGRRSFTGGVDVSYSPLPVPIAFEAMLRLGNGDVITARLSNRHRIRAGANAAGRFKLMIQDFQLEDPGQYNATLILKPDPDYGYQDPEIKAIWNGTLEFPISFSVQQVSRP